MEKNENTWTDRWTDRDICWLMDVEHGNPFCPYCLNRVDRLSHDTHFNPYGACNHRIVSESKNQPCPHNNREPHSGVATRCTDCGEFVPIPENVRGFVPKSDKCAKHVQGLGPIMYSIELRDLFAMAALQRDKAELPVDSRYCMEDESHEIRAYIAQADVPVLASDPLPLEAIVLGVDTGTKPGEFRLLVSLPLHKLAPPTCINCELVNFNGHSTCDTCCPAWIEHDKQEKQK